MTDRPVTIKCTGNKLSIDPISRKLKKKVDQAVWNCSGGRIEVQFKGQNPFVGMPAFADDGDDLPSGVANSNGIYPYTLIITPTDGSDLITVDPQVDVDDVGPPPGHHGASALTKKAKNKKKARRKS